MKIDKVFDALDDWRYLPSYQLERRADIYFAIHLEDIFYKFFGIKIDFIIPEFPIRIGNIYENLSDINKSYKVDYLVYAKHINKVFLVELKTDQSSRREKQDEYLELAEKANVSGLIDGLIKIYKATSQKTKYDNLLNKLEDIGWIKRNILSIDNLNVDIELEILYIQPLNIDNEKNIISFDDIISILCESSDPLTIRFIKSLEYWKSNVNKKRI